jgi:hypothetical protein
MLPQWQLGGVFATGERVVAVEGRQGPFEMKDLRV